MELNHDRISNHSPITDTTMVCSCWFGHDAFFADCHKWIVFLFLNEKRDFVALLPLYLSQARISGSAEKWVILLKGDIQGVSWQPCNNEKRS